MGAVSFVYKLSLRHFVMGGALADVCRLTGQIDAGDFHEFFPGNSAGPGSGGHTRAPSPGSIKVNARGLARFMRPFRDFPFVAAMPIIYFRGVMRVWRFIIRAAQH